VVPQSPPDSALAILFFAFDTATKLPAALIAMFLTSARAAGVGSAAAVGQRRVTINPSRTGLSDERLLERFMAERQTLTLLEHPNIARILDVGTHTDGRPWFAMELVDGISISEWVLARNLGFRERIELLLPVCEAVQHAHFKGADLQSLHALPGWAALQSGLNKRLQPPDVMSP